MENVKLEPVFPRLRTIPSTIYRSWLGGDATATATLVTGALKTQSYVNTSSLPKNMDTTDTERFVMSQEFTE